MSECWLNHWIPIVYDHNIVAVAEFCSSFPNPLGDHAQYWVACQLFRLDTPLYLDGDLMGHPGAFNVIERIDVDFQQSDLPPMLWRCTRFMEILSPYGVALLQEATCVAVPVCFHDLMYIIIIFISRPSNNAPPHCICFLMCFFNRKNANVASAPCVLPLRDRRLQAVVPPTQYVALKSSSGWSDTKLQAALVVFFQNLLCPSRLRGTG